jgi:hypothetical protein
MRKAGTLLLNIMPAYYLNKFNAKCSGSNAGIECGDVELSVVTVRVHSRLRRSPYPCYAFRQCKNDLELQETTRHPTFHNAFSFYVINRLSSRNAILLIAHT